MGRMWAVGTAILVGVGAGLLVTLPGGDDKVPLQGPGAVLDADNARETKSADGDGDDGTNGKKSGKSGGGSSSGGSSGGGGGGGTDDTLLPGVTIPDVTLPEITVPEVTVPSTPVTPITACLPPVTVPLTGVTLVPGYCFPVG